jgi:predicted peptidase
MLQTEHLFRTATDQLHYLLSLPADYERDPTRRWPLMLFLHGRGERGADLQMLKRHGIPRLIDEADDFPFITISPQCPLDTDWTPHLETLIALTDHIEQSYRVDPARVYLTGLSMGGRGSWQLGSMYPDRFAAVVPICGVMPHVPNFLETVTALKDTPVWAFHGDADDIVPIEHSDLIVGALRAVGGNVRYTVYPGVRHNSWRQTYDNPAVYEWMLQHTRAEDPGGN